jgi:predicted adenine nucleotide alpha hydrolase (AANH) superfamily ATPase
MNADAAEKRILLHSCCGPCSSAVVERLLGEYSVEVFYYNPNMSSEAEYELRKEEQKRFLREYGRLRGIDIPFSEGPFDTEKYYIAVKGLEQEPEGGLRCRECFALRLEETAKRAAQRGFWGFDTTLSVSPHKNYEVIRSVGERLAEKYGVRYLAGNYKKQDGFRRSIELSSQFGLYRQNYCGCVYSMRRPE